MWMTFCCTVDYKWVTAMRGVILEFDDIQIYNIVLYEKLLNGDGLSV